MSFTECHRSRGFDAYFETKNDVITPRDGFVISNVPVKEKAERLFKRLVQLHYSPKTIKGDRWMFNLIQRECTGDRLSFYRSLLQRYAGKRQVQTIIRRWMLFDIFDVLPEKHTPRKQKHGYYDSLRADFKKSVDDFVARSITSGHRDSTINSEASALCKFLAFVQESGAKNLSSITETMVKEYKIAFGVANDTITRLGRMIRMIGNSTTPFPHCSAVKHLINVLTPDERIKIEKLLCDDGADLTYMQRAVGRLVQCTGMRTSDVRDLRFRDVDLRNNTIRFVQKKTSAPLEIPLLPYVGNAIVDYILHERPQTESPYLFVSKRKIKGGYCQVSPYKIMSTIYDSCGIRQNARRGAHLLRHSFATQLIEQGADIGIVSNILGHTNAAATLEYISVSAELLRSCFLDISQFGCISMLYKK